MATYHHSPVNLDAISSHCRNGIPAPKPSRCSDVPISRTIIPTVSCTVHPPFLWPRLTRGCPKHRKFRILDTTTPERRVGATGQRNPTASGPTRPSYPTTLTSHLSGVLPQPTPPFHLKNPTPPGVIFGPSLEPKPCTKQCVPAGTWTASQTLHHCCHQTVYLPGTSQPHPSFPNPSAIQTSRLGWAAAWRRRGEITCLHMGHILSPPILPRTGHWKS